MITLTNIEIEIIEMLRYQNLEIKDVQFRFNKSYKQIYRIMIKLRNLSLIQMYKTGFPPKTYYKLSK